MKLNLGCGNDIREGYLNVDFRKTHRDTHVIDLSKMPWPWANGSIEEILMLDFLEHFPYSQTIPILFECYRILKDDGTVVIQVPDGVHLSKALSQVGEYLCNTCGTKIHRNFDVHSEWDDRCGKCGQDIDDISEAAMRRLYGGQDFPGNFHQTCFTQTSLEIKAMEIGLELVGWEERDHQYANWNFKGRFKKGSIW